jgi:hypothetical protein
MVLCEANHFYGCVRFAFLGDAEYPCEGGGKGVEFECKAEGRVAKSSGTSGVSCRQVVVARLNSIWNLGGFHLLSEVAHSLYIHNWIFDHSTL